MATKKAAAKPAPSPKKGNASPAKGEEGREYDPSETRRALAELQARHGKVDDAHRAAFDTLSTNTRRADLGGRTRAPGVLREGVSWAVQIDQAISKYGAVVDQHYARERFNYFLDRLLALDASIAGQGTLRDGTGVKRATSEDRTREARDARNKLLEKMARVAGNRTEKAELDAATGTAEKLGESILGLVTLGRDWLSRKDPRLLILCKSARLTEDSLSAALATSEALTDAGTDATLAGRKPSADSPEVNVAEGWVLQEMMEAQLAFEAANTESRLVARLTPGPATRHVLGSRKAPAPDAPADPTPPT